MTEERGKLNKEVRGNRKEKIQTDGQRHRSTEESSAWFATRFIGDSLWRLVVNRPACKNEYKREEEKKQERHFVKVHRDWDEKPPPSKAAAKKECRVCRNSNQ